MVNMKLRNLTVEDATISNKYDGFAQQDESKLIKLVLDINDLELFKEMYSSNVQENLYRVVLQVANKNNALLPFSFLLRISVDVEIDASCNTDEVVSLLNVNAVTILYQACREKLATLNAMLELPIYRLPIINLMEQKIPTKNKKIKERA